MEFETLHIYQKLLHELKYPIYNYSLKHENKWQQENVKSPSQQSEWFVNILD